MADVAKIARKLGSAQKRAILALGDEWGASGEHAAAVRLWFRKDIPLLLDHRHCANDVWRLRPLGLAIRKHLEQASKVELFEEASAALNPNKDTDHG